MTTRKLPKTKTKRKRSNGKAVKRGNAKPAPKPSVSPSALRVQYLASAYALIRETLMPEAPPVEQVAFSFGFPAAKAAAGRIGEWHGRELDYGSAAGYGEKNLIVIHPKQWREPLDVVHVLAHEMAHAATPGAGHRGAFVVLVRRIGLDGRPTSTVPGEAFKQWYEKYRSALPFFPAGAIALRKRKVQGTRLRLYECSCPIKIRACRDDLEATCELCGEAFALKSGAKPPRIEETSP